MTHRTPPIAPALSWILAALLPACGDDAGAAAGTGGSTTSAAGGPTSGTSTSSSAPGSGGAGSTTSSAGDGGAGVGGQGAGGGSCVPECGGAVCGPDGCGDVCGTCDADQACTGEGQCCTCEGAVAPVPVALSFTAIPDDRDFRAPGRGGEAWHGAEEVDIPEEGAAEPALDVYHRSFFTWARLEPEMGQYDFSRMEEEIHDAIDRRRKMSFGIMTVYPGDEANPSPQDEGVSMTYPAYLHELMQDPNDPANHGATDWNAPSAGWWLPNYNSDHYLDRFDALNLAIADWIANGSYDGVAYADVIGYIDIRGFGAYGEWHHVAFIDAASEPDGSPGSWPVGLRPTVATLERIVDSYLVAFPRIQLAAMIAAFDAEWLNNTWNPPEIAQYVLDAENEVGPVGWRRDQWAAEDQYLHDYLEDNDRSFDGGPPFSTAIMERWKLAPILGEPECSGSDMGALADQVSLYHASMVGNSNFCTGVTATLADNFRAASRRMGYRLRIEGGSAPESAYAGFNIPISLAWHNVGVAPVYERWIVTYELQDPATGETAWSAPSSHELRLFLPAEGATTVDDLVLLDPELAPGTYRLVLKIVDPSGYRDPLPLALEGRNADGSYTLVESFALSACEGCN